MYPAPFMRYSSTLLNQCILGVTFNSDLSRSLFLYNINAWSYVSGKNFWPISSLFVEITNLKIYEKRVMLYNGIFGLIPWKHYVTLFWSNHFLQETYNVDPSNVCQFWDQSVHTLMNLENMQRSYVLFDVTWRKTGHDGRIVLISVFISNILHPTRSLYDSLRLPLQKL